MTQQTRPDTDIVFDLAARLGLAARRLGLVVRLGLAAQIRNVVIIDLAPEIADFDGTMTILEELDLVVNISPSRLGRSRRRDRE